MTPTKTDETNQNYEYCSDLLKRQDEDRWLAARYAPPSLRSALIALGALRLELRRIPSAVSEPALGEIRLQWWREGLAEIRCGKPARAHPVVGALALSPLQDRKYAGRIDAMIDASARLLYGEEFSSIEELHAWLEVAEGNSDAIAVLVAGGGEALADVAMKAGAAFSLAREGERLAPSLRVEITGAAQKLYEEHAPALANAPSRSAPAILHLSLTPHYLQRKGKAFPLRKRLRLFSAMAFATF